MLCFKKEILTVEKVLITYKQIHELSPSCSLIYTFRSHYISSVINPSKLFLSKKILMLYFSDKFLHLFCEIFLFFREISAKRFSIFAGTPTLN